MVFPSIWVRMVISEELPYSEFFDRPPPQKEDFLPFWLATRFIYPEGNYCVRRKIFISCFPDSDSTEFFETIHPFLKFVYNFNIRGYLPVFIPLIANYGRVHTNWLSQDTAEMIAAVGKTIDMYVQGIDEYRTGVMQRQVQHMYRNGEGDVIRKVSEADLESYKRLIEYYHKTYPLYFGYPVSSQPHVSNRFKRGMASVMHRLKGLKNNT